MIEIERSVRIETPAAAVFAYVDDIRNLGKHMSDSRSMALMGSRLRLEVSQQATGVGAVYRYSGRMMGLRLDFTEQVMEYVAGREKAWRTIDPSQIWLVERYVMRVLVEPLSPSAAQLTIRFSYDLPRRGVWRWLGKALAQAYGRWCVESMVDGAKAELEEDAGGRAASNFSRLSSPQIALHWLVVLLVIEQYVTSAAILRTHAYRPLGKLPDPFDMTLHTVHTRLGLAIFVLVAVRLVLRLVKGTPSWRMSLPAGRGRLSAVVQYALYFVLLGEAAAGAIASYLWWPMSVVHRALFWALLALVAIHLGGAALSFALRPRETLYRITGALVPVQRSTQQGGTS